jgi:ribulose-phosphate 3-epimerase
MGRPLIAPSVLSADFAAVGEAVRLIETAGGDWVHMDVMDGHFVPNMTFGPKMVRDVRARTTLPIDTHLMIERPEASVADYARAGSDFITFHIEAVVHADRLISHIEDLGSKPGISLVPSTPADALSEILPRLFQVLVMTVNPGFGGQALIDSCVEKVRYLDGLRKQHGLSFKIAVDGGINEETARTVVDAGADVLVAGSAFFESPDPAGMLAAMAAR